MQDDRAEEAYYRGKPLRDEINKLKAERDAYKKALEFITLIEDQLFGADWGEIDEARNIANAALAEWRGK